MAAAKNFRISRAPSASRDAAASHDPFAKLVFEPALESDELFDALREAYPVIKTHTERKKQAVLDFWMNERQAIEQEITAFVQGAGATAPADNTSPVNPPSASGDDSFSSSAAPSSAESSPETLSLKQMTSVWTASGDAPPKIHHRRSMTTKEKEEYRRRRQMKACQDCRSRKRKCNHNTAAVSSSTAASSGVTSKVKKRSQAPHHTTPSESSFQVEESSVWGESSLMSSVMESPLNFTDFGPPAPMGVEGFEDFLLLPEEDEMAMAFSPDPLFSTTATTAMQNNAFPYAYADPFLPTHSHVAHQTYAQSFGSNSSTSASAYSSPGRSMAPSNAIIAPAQMHQSPQNWDIDLAGLSVNMDLSGGHHHLHGQAPMPTAVTLHSGSSGGVRAVDSTLHVIQPQASRSIRTPATTSSSDSRSSCQLLHSGAAQPLLTAVQQPAQIHTCAGEGTPAVHASSATNTRVSGALNATSPLVIANTSVPTAVQQPARTRSCEVVGTPTMQESSANNARVSRAPNVNSTPVIANTSSSAPATGLACYLPQSKACRCARHGAAVSFSAQDSSSTASASGSGDSGLSTGSPPRCTTRIRNGYGQGSTRFAFVDTDERRSPVSVPARASASASSVVIEGTRTHNTSAVHSPPTEPQWLRSRAAPGAGTSDTSITTFVNVATVTANAAVSTSTTILSVLAFAASSAAALCSPENILALLSSLVLFASVLYSSAHTIRRLAAQLLRTSSPESKFYGTVTTTDTTTAITGRGLVSSLVSRRLRLGRTRGGKVGALFGPPEHVLFPAVPLAV